MAFHPPPCSYEFKGEDGMAPELWVDESMWGNGPKRIFSPHVPCHIITDIQTRRGSQLFAIFLEQPASDFTILFSHGNAVSAASTSQPTFVSCPCFSVSLSLSLSLSLAFFSFLTPLPCLRCCAIRLTLAKWLCSWPSFQHSSTAPSSATTTPATASARARHEKSTCTLTLRRPLNVSHRGWSVHVRPCASMCVHVCACVHVRVCSSRCVLLVACCAGLACHPQT